MCGTRYSPEANPACGPCPLHGGCAAACCPACGYSTVDPARSGLVSLGRRLGAALGTKRAGIP